MRTDFSFQCLVVDEVCCGHILDRDTHGLVERDFTCAGSTGFQAGEHFANFGVDVVLRD